MVYLYFGFYVFRLNPRSMLNRIFLILCLSLSIWGFGLAHVLVAPDRAAALFWLKFCFFGLFFLHGIILHFMLILTGKEKILSKWWIYPVLYMPAVFFIYIANYSPLGGLTVDSFAMTGLGWVSLLPVDKLWFKVYVLYYISFLTAGLMMIWHWGKKTEHIKQKKQANIILFTAVIVMLLGSLTDILPAFLSLPVPQMAVVITSIWIYGIWHAITKYQLMVLSPEVAAEDILKNMTDIVLLVGKDQRIKTANQAMFSLGFREEEIIGQPVDTFINGNTAKRPLMKFLAEEGSVQSLEMNLISSDKGVYNVLLSGSILQDEAGEIIGAVCVFHNITQRKQAERELDFQKRSFEALFKNSTDAILYYDRNYRIVNGNLRFEILFGYTLAIIKGKELFELASFKDKQEETKNFIDSIFAGEQIIAETTTLNRKGEPLEVSVKGVPVVIDGEFVGGYSIYTDISERKRYEENLKYLSLHDGLTGLYNRHYFEEEMHPLKQQSKLPHQHSIDGCR